MKHKKGITMVTLGTLATILTTAVAWFTLGDHLDEAIVSHEELNLALGVNTPGEFVEFRKEAFLSHEDTAANTWLRNYAKFERLELQKCRGSLSDLEELEFQALVKALSLNAWTYDECDHLDLEE